MAKKIRVRSKRLDQVDSTKLALALWLLAREVVEDRTSRPGSRPDCDAAGDAPEVSL